MFNFLKKLFTNESKKTEDTKNDKDIKVTQLEEPIQDTKNQIIKESKRYIISAGENIVKSAVNYKELYGDWTETPKLERLEDNEWRVIDKMDNRIKIVEAIRVGGMPVVIPKEIPTGTKSKY